MANEYKSEAILAVKAVIEANAKELSNEVDSIIRMIEDQAALEVHMVLDPDQDKFLKDLKKQLKTISSAFDELDSNSSDFAKNFQKAISNLASGTLEMRQGLDKISDSEERLAKDSSEIANSIGSSFDKIVKGANELQETISKGIELQPIDVSKAQNGIDKVAESASEARKQVSELHKEMEKPVNTTKNQIPVLSDAKESTTALSEEGKVGEQAGQQIANGMDTARESVEKLEESVNNLFYHWGNKTSGKIGESFGEMISSYEHGISNGHGGYGAFGSGLYALSNPSQFTQVGGDELRRFMVFDTSELNMFRTKTEEQATALFDFLTELQRLCINAGSGYDYNGTFDKEVATVESMYNQAKTIFGNMFMTAEEFNSFVSDMAKLVKDTGLGTGTIRTYKLGENRDNISTRFMKQLGYQGIDNTGTSYDMLRHGNVIFPDVPVKQIESFKTLNELLEYYNKLIQEQLNQIPLLSEEQSSPSTENHIEELKREEQQALETAQAEEKLAETRNESDSSTPQSTLEQRLQAEKEKVEEVVNAEKSSFNELITHLDTNVTNAIERKSSKFEDERDRVHDVVEAEIGELDRLIGHIEEVAPEGSINVKVDTKKSSRSSNGSKSDDYDEEYVKVLSSAYSDAEKTLAYDKERAEQEKEILRLKEKGRKQELAFYEERERKEKEYSDMFIAAEKERNNLIAKQNEERRSNVESLYKGLNSDFTKASNKSDKYPQEYSDALTKIQSKLDELEKYKNLDIINNAEVKDANNLGDSIKDLFDDLYKIEKKANLAKANSVAAQISQYSSALTKNTKLVKESKVQMQGWIKELQNKDINPSRIQEIIGAFGELKVKINEAGNAGAGFVSIFKNKLKYGIAQQLAMYFSFNDFLRYFREIFSTIRELDTALVDLRKTTQMTTSELGEFYFESNNVAKQMGVTTKEIINQASAFSRLGFSTKQAATEMSELSSQFASISPDMDVSTATDGLVSIMKAFDVEVDDVERKILDNINKIGNTAATSNGEIVDMLQRSSAAMKEANNSLEQTIALETAAIEITRNAETTGTAFKTVAMRIRGYDEETEELSEDLENISGKIADLTKTAKTPGGISLFTDKNKTEYKSTYQLLKEISEIYSDLTDKQQAGLLEALAGKRGGQVIGSVLNNFKAAEKAMANMEQAAGSADKEMEIIKDSIDFKLNALQQTWVGTFQKLVDRGDIGKLIDALTNLSEVLGWVIDNAGILGTLTVGGGIFGGLVKDFGIFSTNGRSISAQNPFSGLFDGLGSKTLITENQLNMLERFNNGIENATDKTKFFNETITDGSLKQYIDQTSFAKVGLTKFTTTTKAATIATKALNVAMNAITSIAIVAIITGVVKGIEYLVTAEQRAIDKSNELKEKFQELESTYNSNKKTLQSLESEYNELSKGVSENGKNVSLTEEEYSRYQSIISQIVDIAPSLATAWDKENGLLTNKVDLLKQANDALDEQYYKEIRNSTKKEDNEAFFKGKTEEYNKKRSEVNNKNQYSLNYISRLNKLIDEYGLNKAFLSDVFSKNTEGEWNGIQGIVDIKVLEKSYDELYEYIGDINRDALIEYKSIIDDYNAAMEEDKNISGLSYAEKRNQILKNAIGVEGYGDLDNNSQNFIKQYVDNLGDLSDEEALDATGKIKDFVEKIVNSKDLQVGIDRFFNLESLKDTMTISEYKSAFQSLIDEIFGKLEVDPNIEFNFDDEKINRQKDTVRDFFDWGVKGDAASMLESLSFDDLLIASKLDIEPGTIKSWDELIAKIAEYKRSSKELNTLTKTQTISLINEMSDGFKSLADIFKDIQEGGDFDFTNLADDNNFNKLFQNLDSYGDFVDTISNNTDDIDACREAFNKLVDEYITSNGILKSVTSETASLTTAMLENVGITNAQDLVNARLINSYDGLREAMNSLNIEGENLADLSEEDLKALIDIEYGSEETKAAIYALYLSVVDLNANPVQSIQTCKAFATMAKDGSKLQSVLIQIADTMKTISGWEDLKNREPDFADIAERKINEQKEKLAKLQKELTDYKWGGTAEIEKPIYSGPKTPKETAYKTSENFDWIETKVKRLDEAIASLDETISSTYATVEEKNSTLAKKIDLVTNKIELQKKAYEAYMQAADSVNLAESYKALVRDGDLSIEEIQDAELKEKIKDYQEWYSKALDVQKEIRASETVILDSTVAMYENESTQLQWLRDNQYISEREYIRELSELYKKYYKNNVALAEEAHKKKVELLKAEQEYQKNVNRAAQAGFDWEINSLEDAKDKIDREYQSQIDAINERIEARQEEVDVIQDEIDRLNDENDARKKALELQKAKYELERSQHQRNQQVYTSDRGFTYQTNDKDIKNAQETLNDLHFQAQVDALEKQKQALEDIIDSYQKEIDQIEKLQEKSDKYYDDKIYQLNQLKNEWQQLLDFEEYASNIAIFEEEFGKGSWEQLLNGQKSFIEDWKKNYFNVLTAIDTANGGSISDTTSKFGELLGLTDNLGMSANNVDTLKTSFDNLTMSSDILGDTATETSKTTQDAANEIINTLSENGELVDETINETWIPTFENMDARISEIGSNISSSVDNMANSIVSSCQKAADAIRSLQSMQSSISSPSPSTNSFYRVNGAAIGTNGILKNTEKNVLTGELGEELLVHKDGTTELLGRNGMQMVDLKAGDAVLDHQTTAQLKERKLIDEKGKSMAIGSGRFSRIEPSESFLKFTNSFVPSVQNLVVPINQLRDTIEDVAKKLTSNNNSNSSTNNQEINQTFNITLPNINDSSKATDLMKELSNLSQRGLQYFK